MRLIKLKKDGTRQVSNKPKPGSMAPAARGLVLKASANNPRVKRWERPGEAEPKKEPRPPTPDVEYRHPATGETRTGRVSAGGPKGITVVDHETGQAHKVPHGHYVAPDPAAPGEGKSGAPKKAQGGAKVKPKVDGAPTSPSPKEEEEDGPKFWRKEHPGLSRYPTQGVKKEDVEVGGPEHNWRLRWRHPENNSVQQAYEPAYLKEQARKKFNKMASFGTKLPAFRETARLHVSHPADTELAVLGAMALVTDLCMMRPGGSSKDTTGLTTLKPEHVSVLGDEVIFNYTGKASMPQRQVVKDAQVAQVVQHLLERAPAEGLWGAHDERGDWKPVTLGRFSSYIDDATGGGNPKDFRTWHATRMFAEECDKLGPPVGDDDAERKVQQAALVVAQALGHKKASTHGHFVKVGAKATKAHDLAAKHGGEHYGDGVVGFHTAADRKAYTGALKGTAHKVLSKDEAPKKEDRHTHYQDETSTSLENYIDPTVVQAYRQGLTLSGGKMRKAADSGLTPDERRFQGYLDRVKTADVWGTDWVPDQQEDDDGA